MVKAEAGILESDPTQKVHRKLGKAVHRVVEDPAAARRIATHLGALTGLSGEEAVSAERRGGFVRDDFQRLDDLGARLPAVEEVDDRGTARKADSRERGARRRGRFSGAVRRIRCV